MDRVFVDNHRLYVENQVLCANMRELEVSLETEIQNQQNAEQEFSVVKQDLLDKNSVLHAEKEKLLTSSRSHRTEMFNLMADYRNLRGYIRTQRDEIDELKQSSALALNCDVPPLPNEVWVLIGNRFRSGSRALANLSATCTRLRKVLLSRLYATVKFGDLFGVDNCGLN